jgi:hypothetical protein
MSMLYGDEAGGDGPPVDVAQVFPDHAQSGEQV